MTTRTDPVSQPEKVRLERRKFACNPALNIEWLVVAGAAGMHIQTCINHGFNACPMLKNAVDAYAIKAAELAMEAGS